MLVFTFTSHLHKWWTLWIHSVRHTFACWVFSLQGSLHKCLVLGPNLGGCSHGVFSCVFNGSVLAVHDCSNQVLTFSFWNGPCGCWCRRRFWREVEQVEQVFGVWSSRYSCCHLDKGGSQSLIIYLMCDAIFPDFWVICATDGRTSRVGEVRESSRRRRTRKRRRKRKRGRKSRKRERKRIMQRRRRRRIMGGTRFGPPTDRDPQPWSDIGD